MYKSEHLSSDSRHYSAGAECGDSFFGGGSQIGSTSNKQDRFEAQNFTSWTAGKHFIKAGGRFRLVRLESISPE